MHAGREEGGGGHVGWGGCVGGVEESTFCLAGLGLAMLCCLAEAVLVEVVMAEAW